MYCILIMLLSSQNSNSFRELPHMKTCMGLTAETKHICLFAGCKLFVAKITLFHIQAHALTYRGNWEFSYAQNPPPSPCTRWEVGVGIGFWTVVHDVNTNMHLVQKQGLVMQFIGFYALKDMIIFFSVSSCQYMYMCAPSVKPYPTIN